MRLPSPRRRCACNGPDGFGITTRSGGPMPVVPAREILDRAFAERYGVAAINIVDDLTLEAVLAAATDLQAPLIVQTSLKTVKSIGARPLYAMWRARVDEGPVPV